MAVWGGRQARRQSVSQRRQSSLLNQALSTEFGAVRGYRLHAMQRLCRVELEKVLVSRFRGLAVAS